MSQAVVNIGTCGHVDHGKTTLLAKLSGKWADTHSEERKKGITIKLGYATAVVGECVKCHKLTTESKCSCGGSLKELRKISFVDAPGHETLMATMLSGAATMDGALLLVDASEGIREQTREHLMALEVLQVKRIIIVQNKIDLVSEEDALKSFNEIEKFVKGTIAENAPIIPISAVHGANIDVLLTYIEKVIPTPVRDLNKSPLMIIARSFDVNKPGVDISKLVGGVLGGILMQGHLKTGDSVEIRPGFKTTDGFRPLFTSVSAILADGEKLKDAVPGGTIGVSSGLDMFLTKNDRLSGSVLGLKGELPPVRDELSLDVHITLAGESVKLNEPLMFNVWTSKTVGVPVKLVSKDKFLFSLKIPVCVSDGARVAISKKIGARWVLIGYGIIVQ